MPYFQEQRYDRFSKTSFYMLTRCLSGEIVDAACVNTAADRQVTPSTNAAGTDVLLVQRSFDAGFRPDLVGVQACIGFNGTAMKAVDCAGNDEMVSLVGGQLTATSGACQSGHDDKARLLSSHPILPLD